MQIFIDTKAKQITPNYWMLLNREDFSWLKEEIESLKPTLSEEYIDEHNAKMAAQWFETTAGYKDTSGYVYFVRQWEYVKIGKAKKLNERYRRYVTENPNEVELIHYIESDDALASEREFQARFKEKHYRWEWFKLDDSDLEIIKGFVDEV